jgi:hypothetical protein
VLWRRWEEWLYRQQGALKGDRGGNTHVLTIILTEGYSSQADLKKEFCDKLAKNKRKTNLDTTLSSQIYILLRGRISR